MNPRFRQNKDDVITVSGHGSEGGGKNPMKLNWNSTHHMNMNQSQQNTLRVGDDEFENSQFGQSSANPKQLQRRLTNIHDIERYCRPQQLIPYKPIDSGLKYNVIGLFGLPEAIDPLNPCVYTVLASVFPPGNAYKQKPMHSMFGANFFAEIDFERSLD